MRMRSLIIIVGLILIIAGIASLGYKHFPYRTEEKVAEIGIANVANLKVTEQREKRITIPPAVSGTAIAVGIVLVVIGVRRKSS